jgi:GTP-binding protein
VNARKNGQMARGAGKSGEQRPGKSSAERGVRIARADFAAAAAQRDQIPDLRRWAGAGEIAFAGRSNVGKSSLLNMLLARRGLARTSRTPGCTRQINFFEVAIAAGPELVFVDLPGYGYAKVSKTESAAWRRLLEGYLTGRETLRAVVVLVDIRRGLATEEEDLLEFLATRSDLAVIVAATKLDKLSRSAQKPALAGLMKQGAGRVVGTSAETGAGREELWGRILEHLR